MQTAGGRLAIRLKTSGDAGCLPRVLHGALAQGANLFVSVIRDAAGNLYGTTTVGGELQFAVTPALTQPAGS
jgi:hypothetical protein